MSPETTCTVHLGLGETGCDITFPTGGAKDIRASYLGAPGFAASASTAFTGYSVLITNTTAGALTHTPNPNAPAVAVTVSAPISPVAPGGGTVSGTVTVQYNALSATPDTGSCNYTLPAQSNCNVNLTQRGDYGLIAVFQGNFNYGGAVSDSVIHRVNHLPQLSPESYFTFEDQALARTDPYGQTTPGNPNDDGPLANDLDVDSDIGQVLTVQNVSVGGIGGSVAMNANGTFTYTPLANASGQATVSYQVTDGVESVPASFTIDVTAVNDKPSITLLGDLTFPAGDTSMGTVPGFSLFSPGPPDESGQSVNFYFVQRVAGDFISSANIDNNGTLSYSIVGPPTGVDVWSVVVTDSGGSQYGGQDTSDPRYFHIVKGPGSAELSITKTNNASRLRQYQPTTYTIVVSNAGPDTAPYVSVKDPLPPTLKNASWTCAPSGAGASCPASGSGGIDAYVTLPSGTSVAFTLTATVDSPNDAPVVNTATVGTIVGFTDTASNNSASDTDAVDLFRDGFE